MKKFSIKLDAREQIIAVIPEYCGGPGWSNAPIWVHIEHRDTHRLRTECIQPEHQTPVMLAMFRTLQSAQQTMLGEIRTLVKQSKGPTP